MKIKIAQNSMRTPTLQVAIQTKPNGGLNPIFSPPKYTKSVFSPKTRLVWFDGQFPKVNDTHPKLGTPSEPQHKLFYICVCSGPLCVSDKTEDTFHPWPPQWHPYWSHLLAIFWVLPWLFCGCFQVDYWELIDFSFEFFWERNLSLHW